MEPTQKRLAGFKALVVEDVADAREILETCLRIAGAEVLGAAGGNEAVLLAQTHEPDIILMDVMMPQGDGWAAMIALKSDPRTWEIPVIIMTAKGPRMKNAFDVEGAAAYFIKPIDVKEVLDKVYEILVLERALPKVTP